MSFQIAKVRGIPVRLHFTLLIAFFLIMWTLAANFMPQYFPGLSTVEYWAMGAAGAAVLFFSVFLHELAHSVVAIGYGMKVRQIMLFIFGGVSDISEETKDFRKEFRIAIAGPAASFAIAGALGAAWFAASSLGTVAVVEGVLLYGAIINALVGAFNLIPAFPLDGGRILRSGLIRWKKSYDDATRIAAKVGIGISYGFMGLGFLLMITGSFVGGIWILLIGWFLNSGAQSYLSQHELTTRLAGVRLKDIMNSRVIAVGEGVAVDGLLRDYFGTHMKSAFPVVDASDRLLGMVTLKQAADVPLDQRRQATAGQIMTPAGELVTMPPDRKADEALKQMARSRTGKVFVCSKDGTLLGLVSKTDIMNVASERQEYERALKDGSPAEKPARMDSEAA